MHEVITLLYLVLLSLDSLNSFECCVLQQTGAVEQTFGLLFQQLNFCSD